MAAYYIAETAVNAHLTPAHWVACKARTEVGAKRAAQAARIFQGTEAHIGARRRGGEMYAIATRAPSGEWTEQQ